MAPVTRSDVVNEDWLRTGTWDIWLGSRLVASLDDLREYCGRQRITLDHFLRLPAVEAMPEELKAEVAIYRQERIANQLAAPAEGTTAGVVDVMEEVLEKGLFRRGPRKVRTEEGAERYDQPIGSIIRPDLLPDTPKGGGRRKPNPNWKKGVRGDFTLDTPDGNVKVVQDPVKRTWRFYGVVGPDDRQVAETGFQTSDRAKVAAEDEVLKQRRTHAQRSAAPDTGRAGSSGKGHYGRFDIADYVSKLRDGDFPSWTTTYRAAWLTTDGKVEAVADHDAIPGGRERSFNEGNVRVAIAGLPNDPTVNFQIRGKANVAQQQAILKLMDYLNAQRSVVDVHGNTRGDDAVNGEFPFASLDDLRRFLRDPSKKPEEADDEAMRVTRERIATYRQFRGEYKTIEEFEAAVADAVERGDIDVDVKGVRRVRTPAGARRFRQPIGTIIKPDVIPDLGRVRGARSVLDALQRAVTGGGGDRESNIRRPLTGKPNDLLDEREARLAADPDYREKFEAALAELAAPLPESHRHLDPASKNPEYRHYLDDLNRRLAHAIAEPGPLHWDRSDPERPQLTLEGSEVVDRLVDDIIEAGRARGVGRNRRAVIAAGVSGAGKTTVLKDRGDALAGVRFNTPQDREPANFVVVNADDIKEMLHDQLHPDYAALGINPDESAALLHNISSKASRALMNRLLSEGYDFVFDGTYGGNFTKRNDDITKIRAAGYRITSLLVDGDVGTSLLRAAGRHIAVDKRMTKEELKKLDLSVPGAIDAMGIPPGGYVGRFVPVSVIGDQIRKSDTLTVPGGDVLDTAPWGDPPEEWKSSNAMNFWASVAAGHFDRWIVVDSQGDLVAQGGDTDEPEVDLTELEAERGGLPAGARLVGAATKAAATEGVDMDGERSPARAWLVGSEPGTYRLIEAAARYHEGDMTWEQLVEQVRGTTLKPTLGYPEISWQETEDSFPQPGTYDELMAAKFSDALTADEFRQLSDVLKGR